MMSIIITSCTTEFSGDRNGGSKKGAPEDLSGVYGGGRFTSEGDRERDKPRCESGGVLY